MDKSTRVILAVALSFILISSGFIGGFLVSRVLPGSAASGLPAPSLPSADVGAMVDDVYGILKQKALKPPNETSATAGAIAGLLESNGDKYAMYMDAKHYKAFNEDSMGAFGGIGVVLGENKDGKAYVVEVYKDTPAERAGVKAGDVFVSIDGATRTKWTSEEIVKLVRGDAGTKVTLVVARPPKDAKGTPTDLTFTITRAKINIPNVESEKMGDVGYIRLGQFNAKAADDIKKEIDSLTKQGARSFVLDLRDDPGGLLDQAVAVTSLFVGDGVVVRVDERNKPEDEIRATGAKVTDAPVVVLINGDSASASEITAGALQDYGRAVLVGEKSFGKGSVQTVEELGDSTAIKFTIAHYLTPKRRVIDGVGLVPDYIVVMDPEKQMDKKTDTQLQKALELARRKVTAAK